MQHGQVILLPAWTIPWLLLYAFVSFQKPENWIKKKQNTERERVFEPPRKTKYDLWGETETMRIFEDGFSQFYTFDPTA